MEHQSDRIGDWNLRPHLEDFSTWPLADLLEELKTVRTLTPDQEDIIEELEAEIERRRAA